LLQKANRNSQCDEIKPQCKKCQLYGITCYYAESKSPSKRSRSLLPEFADVLARHSSPNADGHIMSLVVARESLHELLQIRSSHSNLAEPPPTNCPVPWCLDALRHFSDVTVHTLSTPSVNNALQRNLLPMAFEVCQCSSLHKCTMYPVGLR
jgi:hypothetical protein